MNTTLRSCRCAALILLAVASYAATARAEKKIEYGLQFWSSNDPKARDDQIPWIKVLTEMKDKLGRVKQLNYFLDVCYAGQAIAQSDTASVNLGMPHTMNVACEAEKKMEFGQSPEDLDPPRRLYVSSNYFFSFTDYLTKRLDNNNPVPTVKQLFDAAKADVTGDTSLKGQVPQFVKRLGGDDGLKIKGDAAKSRALLFGADCTDMYQAPFDQCYRVVKAYGFDSIVMYYHGSAQNLTRNPPIQGKGTWGNFKAALDTLKTQLTAGDAGTQMVNLIHMGHGYRSTIDDGRSNNGSLVGFGSGPGQGRVIAGSDQLAIPADSTFWISLKASLFPPPLSYPDLRRILPPRLFMAYSGHSLSQSFSISIQGIPLGTFTLPNDSPSGTLVVELSDDLLRGLIGFHDGEPELTIQFGLAAGDMIRLGVEDDLLLDPDYLPTTYGMGLSTVVAGVSRVEVPTALARVPMAAPGGLLVLVLLTAATGCCLTWRAAGGRSRRLLLAARDGAKRRFPRHRRDVT